MTGDFDALLRERLSRLAAAVPVVPSPSIDVVAPAPIHTGSGARLSFGGLIPVLAVIVIGTVLAGLAKVGPFAPGSSSGNGPVVATTVDGDFQLTIRSAKARYASSETVEIVAALSYRGGDSSVIIYHGFGSPMSFGVVEPVNGLQLSPGWLLSCGPSTLERAVPLEKAFRKSGGFDGNDPRASAFEAYYADPRFILPPGTWHPYVQATFGVGGCGTDPHSINAEIEITVSDLPAMEPSPTVAATNVPASPTPTVAPRPIGGAIQPDGSVLSIGNNGAFELRVASPEAVAVDAAPITVSTEFAYVGPSPAETVGTWDSLVTFTIEQVDAIDPKGRVTILDTAACMDVALVRDVYRDADISDLRMVTADQEDRVRVETFGDSAVLRLPVGQWRITASLGGYLKGCEVAPYSTSLVKAAIDITVVAASAGEIDLWTAAAPPKGCRLAMGGGILVLHPESGLGVVAPGASPMAVTWPYGYTARREATGGVLIDPDGVVVAREGDHVRFTGGRNDGSFYACTGIHVTEETFPP